MTLTLTVIKHVIAVIAIDFQKSKASNFMIHTLNQLEFEQDQAVVRERLESQTLKKESRTNQDC